jgi:periplasmic divalent cation tolerance protein
MKSHSSLFNRLKETLKQIHPYDEPEIIATPIILGSATYLDWLAGELQNVDAA